MKAVSWRRESQLDRRVQYHAFNALSPRDIKRGAVSQQNSQREGGDGGVFFKLNVGYILTKVSLHKKSTFGTFVVHLNYAQAPGSSRRDLQKQRGTF